MKTISILPLLTGLVLLAGCASMAHIEKDESVNFDKYKTFAWVNGEDSSKSFLSDIQVSNLQKAVSAELTKANWQESKTKPDVILKHDVLVEKAIKENRDAVYSRSYTRPMYNPYTRRWVYVYYPSQFMGYDRNSYETKEGTITITMVDAKSDKVIWQGWTTEEVDRNITSNDIQSGVKNIFRKFYLAKK
jgi:hypothetical protein